VSSTQSLWLIECVNNMSEKEEGKGRSTYFGHFVFLLGVVHK
jgi:hypothetical protein